METTEELVRRAQAVADGWTDAELRDRVRRGDLTRLRRGGYVRPTAVTDATPEVRHRLAVELARPGLAAGVVSHVSAAALWNLPLVGADLTRVHLTLPTATRTGRIGPERHDHTARLDLDEIAVVDGIRVTSAARTLVDLARSGAPSTAVVCADAALQRALITSDELATSVARAKGRPGVNRARRTLSTADGRSESPGETLTRLAVRSVAEFDLQVEITDENGHFVGRADLGVRGAGLLVEFDGRRKYVVDRRAGESIEDAVLAEKHREDRLRALGYGMVRVVWSDLRAPEVLVDLVRRALERGRRAVERGDGPRGGYTPLPRRGL